jgi:hypothetical protein
MSRIPRDAIHQAEWWTAPAGMPAPKRSRKVQSQSWPELESRAELTARRRDWVKRAFLHAWEGYKASKSTSAYK